jgi:hypothetical protein
MKPAKKRYKPSLRSRRDPGVRYEPATRCDSGVPHSASVPPDTRPVVQHYVKVPCNICRHEPYNCRQYRNISYWCDVCMSEYMFPEHAVAVCPPCVQQATCPSACVPVYQPMVPMYPTTCATTCAPPNCAPIQTPSTCALPYYLREA